MEDIIYYLCGSELYSNKLKKYGCKIGSTKYIISRMKTYQTGYADKVPLKYYFKINHNCYEIDILIQKTFNEYRLINMGSDGGTEIYDSEIITVEKLENFLKDFGSIKYEPNHLEFESYKHKINKKDIIQLSKEDNDKNIIFEKLVLSQQKSFNEDNMYKNLYNWQKEAYDEYITFFESKDKAGLIIAPTATGKSYFMNFISIYHYIRTIKKDVLIMTKKKEILDNNFINQGKEFIKQLNLDCEFVNLINLDDKFINNNIFSVKNKNLRIFIINIDKFISSYKFSSYEKYSFGNVKLLLFDECHWCGATQIFNFINYMKHNIVDKIIGFSATPIRQKENNKENSLELFKKSSNEYNIIYIRSYLDSIKDGDRVKTNWIPIKTSNKKLENNEVILDNIDMIKSRCLTEKGFEDFTSKLNKFLEDNHSICGKGILWFRQKRKIINFSFLTQ